MARRVTEKDVTALFARLMELLRKRGVDTTGYGFGRPAGLTWTLVPEQAWHPCLCGNCVLGDAPRG